MPIADGALVDGSGLDRGNRVTCDDLVATLDLGDRPEFDALLDGLPVAGRSARSSTSSSGTARRQVPGQDRLAQRRDRARRHASTSGGRSGSRSSSTASSPRRRAMRIRVQHRQIIARFPDAPPADALVPAPQ